MPGAAVEGDDGEIELVVSDQREQQVGGARHEQRLAGDRALGLGVADFADAGKSLEAMISVGLRLRDEEGPPLLVSRDLDKQDAVAAEIREAAGVHVETLSLDLSEDEGISHREA